MEIKLNPNLINQAQSKAAPQPAVASAASAAPAARPPGGYPPADKARIKQRLMDEYFAGALYDKSKVDGNIRVFAVLLAATCDGTGVTVKEAERYGLIANENGTIPLYDSTNLRSRLSDLTNTRKPVLPQDITLRHIWDKTSERSPCKRWFVNEHCLAAALAFLEEAVNNAHK